MNVLVHICCAPCAIGLADELRREGHTIAGYFYNPNIHPFGEFLQRKQSVEQFAKDSRIAVTAGEYRIDDFFGHAVDSKAPSDRCPVCWRVRMFRTAKFARENGFDAFTTTLLASPYQDHIKLKAIGEDVAGNSRIAFLYKDFRPGFRSAQERAKEHGYYRQKYCGCLYSEIERFERKQKGA